MNRKPGALYQASAKIHVYWCSFEDYLNAYSEAILVEKGLAARVTPNEYFMYVGSNVSYGKKKKRDERSADTFIRLKTNQLVWMRDFATTYLDLVSE